MKRKIVKNVLKTLVFTFAFAALSACGSKEETTAQSQNSVESVGSLKVGVVGTSTRGGVYALADKNTLEILLRSWQL